MSIGSFFKSLGKDAEEVVVAPVAAAEKLLTVINEVKTDVPELKTALAGLFTKLEAVGKDAASDTSVPGVLANGVQTIKDAVSAVEYFNVSVLPILESIYGQIKADVGTAPAPVPAAPALAVQHTGAPA